MWQTLHVSPPMTHKCYMGAHHMKWCLETGNTPNISEYAKFVWYEPIYYYENVPFPQTKRQIACWLGVMYWIGEALCYWILINTGQLIAWSTIENYLMMNAYHHYHRSRSPTWYQDTTKTGWWHNCNCSHEGNLIGKAHHNPVLGTRVYELEFGDGHVAEFSTEIIAENT